MMKVKVHIMALSLSLVLTGCDGSSSENNAMAGAADNGITDPEWLASISEDARQWTTHGGTYNEERFSPLDQITPDNIDQLGLAWFADLGTNRGQQATPLVVDGVIYVGTSWSRVLAYDAKIGERLWLFDPEVAGETGAYGCCDVITRGVAYSEGKIYLAAYDGRLIALDAESGTELWSTVTVDQSKSYTLTGAPRVVNGKVFIGNAGAEYVTRGYISAYDGDTGDMLWRFYTIPGNPELGFENDAMEMAAETWTGQWWELGGGGNVWDGITYDEQSNLLIFGVGNGSPWNPNLRSPDGGDNLFLSSIVAVDADNGEYAWHYQEVPADEWDFDAVAQITLTDLEINGVMRHVLMQAAKSGYYYLIDAFTGELLLAENFVPVNWAFSYDLETGRPVINEAAQYSINAGAVIAQPGNLGAHAWHPASYSLDTGLLYIPAFNASVTYTDYPEPNFGNMSIGVDYTGGNEAYAAEGNTIVRRGPTQLIAWDPVKAEALWSIEQTGGPSGVLSTAGGLVFQGYNSQQTFIAYRADTGEQLWSTDIQTGVSAGPVAYAIDSEQYIAQVVGGTQQGGYYAPSYSRLLVYKLGGDAQLPAKPEYTQRPFNPPELNAADEVLIAGEQLYNRTCSLCHGNGGTNQGLHAGSFPDLRRTPLLHSADAFNAVVLEGSLQARGMGSYADFLDADDAFAIQAYLASRAQAALNPAPLGGL